MLDFVFSAGFRQCCCWGVDTRHCVWEANRGSEQQGRAWSLFSRYYLQHAGNRGREKKHHPLTAPAGKGKPGGSHTGEAGKHMHWLKHEQNWGVFLCNVCLKTIFVLKTTWRAERWEVQQRKSSGTPWCNRTLPWLETQGKSSRSSLQRLPRFGFSHPHPLPPPHYKTLVLGLDFYY